MTKNEIIAGLLLEAAELLRDDPEQESLNEGFLDRFKKKTNINQHNIQSPSKNDEYVSKEELNKIPKNICGLQVHIKDVYKDDYDKILQEIELLKKTGSKKIKKELVSCIYDDVLDIYKHMGYDENKYPVPLSKMTEQYLYNKINISLSISNDEILGLVDFPHNLTSDFIWSFNIKNGLPVNINCDGD